jgi:hypothetical protein
VSWLPLASTGRTPLTVNRQAAVVRGARGVVGAAEAAGADDAGAPEHAGAHSAAITVGTAMVAVLRRSGPQASRMA